MGFGVMNPIKPGTHNHPTGQRYNISLAIKDNKRRWQRSAKLINDVIEKLPKKKLSVDKSGAPKVTKDEKRRATLATNKADAAYILNNSEFDLPSSTLINELKIIRNAVRYEYLLDSAQMNNTMNAINQILREFLLGGSDSWNSRFFLNQSIDEAFADGTLDSFNSALRITEGTPVEAKVSSLTVQQQLQSPAYVDRLQLIHGRVFESMKGLAGDMVAQLRVTLTEGMARGVGIRDLKGMVNKRLGIGMGRAERIARTEINNAYRGAYLDEAKHLNETALVNDDWKIMQAHRSALSPTTRPNHASRHGTIHTIIEQKDWWATGSNAINCLCSTLDVLVNKVTGEVLQSKMIKVMNKQRSEWFPS